MSNNAIIDQIIANADIVKIIGKHVELKRSGNEFKGCCPFHGEKTPSFFVNPQKGLYNCFGCGVAGNALTFLKEYENLTAGDALKELSRQTGIELPKEPINKSHTYKKTPVPPKPAVSKASASFTSVPPPFPRPISCPSFWPTSADCIRIFILLFTKATVRASSAASRTACSTSASSA